MKGDFTRDTFDVRKHYSRVLTQQGRVTLDADPNEQTAILLHYLRTMTRDVIGPHGGPVVEGGFVLAFDKKGGFTIGTGRYYVDGFLVENHDETATYLSQPDFPVPEDDDLRKEIAEPSGTEYWVYLDVWERHITALEDDYIREKALGGPDTGSRAKVIWQVKARSRERLEEGGARTRTALNNRRKKKAQLEKELEKTEDPQRRKEIEKELQDLENMQDMDCMTPLGDLMPLSRARLAARVDPGRVYEDPCEMSPEARYRGTENHLYRVEIHDSGQEGQATFKWSRDNGSVATAWLGSAGKDLEVADSKGFAAGNWVELSDDSNELQSRPGVLVKLAKVEGTLLSVDPDSVAAPDGLTFNEAWLNPKVRRWDQTQNNDIVLVRGAVEVTESEAGKAHWIDLEDGVQVLFEPDGEYRTGDYWLIPARVATGDIEWPEGDPVPTLPPHGIVHHYAPLGFVVWRNNTLEFTSCRCEFEPLAQCAEM